ncbi:hypothetical protein GGC47_004883 [Bosea sp. OAE752]|uniref:hypothetical protein n=1 Tax=Bosea sp. OAE752 TaxID=2663873 RepID=UPI003D1B45BD
MPGALGALVVVAIQSLNFQTAADATVEVQRTRARLLLDGALQVELERMLMGIAPEQVHRRQVPSPDGTGSTITFSVSFEDGKIDVNAGPTPLLRDALRAGGADADSISEMLATVTSVRQRQGAFADARQILPLSLRLAPGSDKIVRFLTTSSRTQSFNPRLAEPELLGDLQALPDAVRARVIALGRNEPTAGPPPAPGPWQGWLGSARDTIKLAATLQGTGGLSMARSVVFRIDRNRQRLNLLRSL